MKLGFLTAAFPDLSLEQVADWASANGFQTLEIACWPAGGGERRRYAGVSHIDVDALDDDGARRVHELLGARGLEISSLAYYPNNLHPDQAHREEVNEHLRTVVRRPSGSASRSSARSSGGTGRSVPDNLADVPRGVAAARRARAVARREDRDRELPDAVLRRRVAGRHEPRVRAGDLARAVPVIPDEAFGLNLDPSHLVWQMIDYERAVYDFADRILHVHAKDMEIRRDGLYEHGVLGAGIGWQVPRLPGLGEVRWDRFLAALYAVGYDRGVSIEHEDRAFEGDVELVKRGFLLARDVLRPLIV